MSINVSFVGEQWRDPTGILLTITSAEEELGAIWAVFGTRLRMMVYDELAAAGWVLVE